MSRLITIIAGFLLTFLALAQSQEVVITGFPVGVGNSVDSSFFEHYYPNLQEIADTLQKYPLAQAIITGFADGIRYRLNNDSNNPSLAIGRAHVLRNLFINKFNVDTDQIVVQSTDVKVKGDIQRSVSIRVNREIERLGAQLDTLANRPPLEKHITEIIREPSASIGLQLSAGYSSSPFGGIPILAGAVTWKRLVFIETVVGHTIWNDSFRFGNTDLNTRLRMAGGQAVFYPLTNIPVGLIAGWIRFEEVSRSYSKYVQMSEGLNMGIRVIPYNYLSITGVYNPAKHHTVRELKSISKNNQFLFYATLNIVIGGEK